MTRIYGARYAEDPCHVLAIRCQTADNGRGRRITKPALPRREMSEELEGNAVGKAANNLAGQSTGLDRAGLARDRKRPIAYPNNAWLQKSYEQHREDAEWYEQWLGEMGLVKRTARRVFRFIVGWFVAWHLFLVGLIIGIAYDFSETAAEYAAGVSLVLLVASWVYIFRHEDEWDRYDFVRNAAIRRRVEAKRERKTNRKSAGRIR